MTALVLSLALTAAATGEPFVFSLHVGVNAAPADSGLEPLRFADDDALRFYAAATQFADSAHVLATADDTTQARYSDFIDHARPPDLAGLNEVTDALKIEMERAKAEGFRPVFLFSYSGHGQVDEAQGALFTLADSVLDQATLESLVLGLPFDEAHLFIDACHAGALVGGRGTIKLEGKRLSAAEADKAWGCAFFQRNPRVGITLATSSSGIAHEWARLESGVFTYEVVSGLLGAADINNDGRIVYSELGGYIAAANRSIEDPRGRVRLVMEPPRQNKKSTLMDVGWYKSAPRLAVKEPVGHVTVLRTDGARIADFHADEPVTLLLPPPHGRFTVVTARGHSASFSARSGATVSYADLDKVRDTDLTSRGNLDEAFRKGFFAAPYNRSYYLGFADSRGFLAEEFPRGFRDVDATPRRSEAQRDFGGVRDKRQRKQKKPPQGT